MEEDTEEARKGGKLILTVIVCIFLFWFVELPLFIIVPIAISGILWALLDNLALKLVSGVLLVLYLFGFVARQNH